MTTNGVLLHRLAQSLAQAGLQRVNISIDALDPKRFREMTRQGSLEDVWQGIRAAEAAGLGPVKLNAVIVRGFNEADVPALARLTLDHPWQVRFIEMMPFGVTAELQTEQIVTHEEVRRLIEEAVGPLVVVNSGHLDGEARLFRLPGAQGEIGLISSVTQPFCATCTRARLTADGRLRLCLLRDKEVDLLTPLRSGANEAELRRLILDGIWNKPWGHGLADEVIPLDRTMNAIGG
jgi:cyclic pyranopterin phosphate synthase